MANVLSCIALFVALSGAAVAAQATLTKNQVKAKNVAKQAITTPKLKNGAVTTGKIANGAIVSPKLANGAVRSTALGGSVVTTPKLKNGAVTGEKITDGAVTNSKLGPDAVNTGKLQDGAVTASKLAPSFNGQLLKNVSYASAMSADNSSEASKSATATCPAGKQVIGGGAQIVGTTTTVAITQSGWGSDIAIPPSGVSPSSMILANGWSAKAMAITPEANAWAVEAIAVCAEL